MMVVWSEIQSWNASEVAALGGRLIGIADALRRETESLIDAVGLLRWYGDAADAARRAILAIHDDFLGQTNELSRVGVCVAGLATSMYPLSAVVRDCEDMAETNTMVVEVTGNIVDALGVYATASGDAWTAARDRTRMRREIEERVRAALARATEIDDDAAAAIDRTPTGPGSAAAQPDLDLATAPANAAYWDALTSAQRTTLLVEQPGVIGNLDGIPADIRDSANRRMLVLERTRLLGVAADLRVRLGNNHFGGLFGNADAGLEQTEKRLEALDEIAETLDTGHRQLLVLDNTSAEQTLAAIAVGDVHTATHVAVFVPGLDSDVAGDMRRYDQDMDGLENTVEHALPSGETVACVTWMNYQAPHLGWSLLDPRTTVMSPMAAALGSPRLTSFLDGLDASRSQDPHLTLLGHSYGSLTAALASKGVDSTGVDEMVALGSPGLGVDRIDTLSVPPEHVFVGESRGDVIADLGIFGGDPSEKAGVVPLATRSDTALAPSHGHSEYLTDGTVTQKNVALVVAGRSAEIPG
ncbi:alpha/beta hydrolase [Rhodococcus sp. G-MC3]|uniref:alpha/beta hydrolase n=1 Tax=Rhodococcus sp. G-MC3 TaxID=3046209 RepID=UPI0024B8E93F|nr:alpha/beta hydrolase [Rhodococcus sp. G-MC3]MDJ0393547.1 alpha/beta hydrolase [Rhodococcus sp. G-MC3]